MFAFVSFFSYYWFIFSYLFCFVFRLFKYICFYCFFFKRKSKYVFIICWWLFFI